MALKEALGNRNTPKSTPGILSKNSENWELM